MGIRLQFAAASDVGQNRRNNQDRWLVRDDLQLAAVADGMGGMPCGEEAAQTAIDTLAARVDRGMPNDLEAWSRLLDDANREVYGLGLRLGVSPGPGTTLTVIHAQNDRLVMAHIGDSAVLRLRNGELEQLTAEHTVAAEFRALRAAGVHKRMPHGAEHMLSSCLGLPFLPQRDVHDTDLQPGDRLLVCSDGLTKPVEADAIRDALAHAGSPELAVQSMIDLANSAGGPDNITAIVAFVTTRLDRGM